MSGLKVAVAVNVYKEPPRQIEECFGRIARNLRGARVMVFENGEVLADVRQIAGGLSFSVVTDINLGTNRTWHLWWLRMLEFFKISGADVCFKFDPDTMVDKAPAHILEASYFGHVAHNPKYGFSFVQGGIIGLSAEAVRRVLSAKLLEPGPNKVWFTQLSDRISLADDQLIALALRHIGIHPVQWGECRSLWKQTVRNDPMVKAIVHPRYYE